MASNKKKTHRHRPLPPGMSYADKLARDRMVKEAVEKAARDDTVRLQADIRTQRMMWLQIVSMADAFGLGPKRILDYFDTLQQNTEEFTGMVENHGMEYALEKLRQRAEKVSGIPIEYLYEKEILDAKKRNEARGVFFSVLEEEV